MHHGYRALWGANNLVLESIFALWLWLMAVRWNQWKFGRKSAQCPNILGTSRIVKFSTLCPAAAFSLHSAQWVNYNRRVCISSGCPPLATRQTWVLVKTPPSVLMVLSSCLGESRPVRPQKSLWLYHKFKFSDGRTKYLHTRGGQNLPLFTSNIQF